MGLLNRPPRQTASCGSGFTLDNYHCLGKASKLNKRAIKQGFLACFFVSLSFDSTAIAMTMRKAGNITC